MVLLRRRQHPFSHPLCGHFTEEPAFERTLAPIICEEVGYLHSCKAAWGADTTKLHTDPDCLLLGNLEMR